MEQIFDLVNKTPNTYLGGSYVYNKIIINSDDYNDIDIITPNVERFEDKLKSLSSCKLIRGSWGEYGDRLFVDLQCDGIDKNINIIKSIYAEYGIGISDRSKHIYDAQRVMYDVKTTSIFHLMKRWTLNK